MELLNSHLLTVRVDVSDLMRLKKMPTRMGGKKEKKGEAFISRFAGGLCFDFHTRDSNM